MFIIDDIVLRSLGFSIPGFDMLWTLEQVRDFAFKERAGAIKDGIKENRMLYEFGEISQKEYEKNDADLKRQLKMAERVEEMDLNTRIDILGN